MMRLNKDAIEALGLSGMSISNDEVEKIIEELTPSEPTEEFTKEELEIMDIGLDILTFNKVFQNYTTQESRDKASTRIKSAKTKIENRLKSKLLKEK